MKVKKLIVASLCLLIFLPFQTLAFSDLNSSDWFYEATSRLVGEDIVKGYSDNTIRPANGVNRAELAVLLYRALDLKDIPISGARYLAFSDVEEDDWYFEAFSVLVGENVFDPFQVYPSRKLNRAELAVVIVRFLEAAGIDLNTKAGAFSDVPSSAWFSDAVGQLNRSGIMTGYSNNTFAPAKNVNRAEVFVVINRMLDTVEEHLSGQNSVLAEARNISSNSKNCEDIDCLIEAAQTCESAHLSSRHEMNFFYPFALEIFQKIDEREGRCEYYLRYDDAEAFMGGMIYTEETLEEANKDLEIMIGMDGVCSSEDEEKMAEAIENNWKEGNFSAYDFKDFDCYGPAFDGSRNI